MAHNDTFQFQPLRSSEPEKPKRPLTAYNLFFRDERHHLLHSLPGKITFGQLAHGVSAAWKVTSEEEKLYYKLLAMDEKLRYNAAMAKWNAQVKEHKAEQANRVVRAVTDLPPSLDDFFDEVSVPDEDEPSLCITTTDTSSVRVCDESPLQRTTEETASKRQAAIEDVFGHIPKLLDDIGDDAPWPF